MCLCFFDQVLPVGEQFRDGFVDLLGRSQVTFLFVQLPQSQVNLGEVGRRPPGIGPNIFLCRLDRQALVEDLRPHDAAARQQRRQRGQSRRIAPPGDAHEHGPHGLAEGTALRRLATVDSLRQIGGADIIATRSEITDEQYDELYHHLTHDFGPPLARTHFRVVASAPMASVATFYVTVSDVGFAELVVQAYLRAGEDQRADLERLHGEAIRGPIELVAETESLGAPSIAMS